MNVNVKDNSRNILSTGREVTDCEEESKKEDWVLVRPSAQRV